MVFYFTHIFFVSLEFNEYMLSVLNLKTKILNRQSMISILTSYKYELGLYEYNTTIGPRLLR